MISTARPRPLWRRVCGVLADEGVAGLGRRLTRSQGDGAEDPQLTGLRAEAARDHQRRLAEFAASSSRLGAGDVSNYYWYHTVDLGNGIVTPGDYDYRPLWPEYGFPSDMRGMKVLDVGSATGFFAFEFEKRGAEVTSVDLPSVADWDIPHGDKGPVLASMMQAQKVSTLEELNHVHIEGPFQLCRKALGSRVTRTHSRIYDLSPAKLGGDAFDLIFVGDVLLHTFSPLAGLAALAPLCKGVLVVAQILEEAPHDQRPLMVYTGGVRSGEGDSRTWWQPNRLCLEQMLKRVGFRDVTVAGTHRPYPGRGGDWLMIGHTVFHARK